MAKRHLRVVLPNHRNPNSQTPAAPNNDLRTREYLTEAEVERLMKAATRNRWGHRDSTMVLVAYRHGLRAAELVDLRWDQIKTANLHVRRVKQGRIRTCCGMLAATNSRMTGHDTRALQAYLGHKNIQHTVRYTELAPTRFKDFGVGDCGVWLDWPRSASVATHLIAAPPTRGRRKYVLEYLDGGPLFRLAEMPSSSSVTKSRWLLIR
jgi:integrase